MRILWRLAETDLRGADARVAWRRIGVHWGRRNEKGNSGGRAELSKYKIYAFLPRFSDSCGYGGGRFARGHHQTRPGRCGCAEQALQHSGAWPSNPGDSHAKDRGDVSGAAV